MSETDLDFDDEDESTETEAKPDQRQDNQKQAFERLKRKHEKELARVREEAERSVERRFVAKGLAKDLGLTDGLSARYLKELGDSDPTEDGLKTFAEELGITVKTEEAQTEKTDETPAAPVDTQAAAAFHQGGGTPTSAKRVTAIEALENAKSGAWSEAEYRRYVAEKHG